jgi:CRP-like cAMP-binding protein
VLVSQGEDISGNECYFVVSGAVDICVTAPDGSKSVLENRQAGMFLGETALFHQVPRAELFVCKEPCTIRSLSYAHFQRFLLTASAEVRAEVEKLKDQDMANRLQQVPLLSSLSVHQRMQLANLFKFEKFSAEQLLFNEGDMGDKFYMILTGQVDILVNNKGESVKLASRSEGEAFGEIALLEDAPRTASVKATVDVLCLTLVKSNFERFVEVVPRMKQELSILAEERLATRLSVMSLFKNLAADKLALLASLLKFERSTAGDTIFSVGEVGDKFYLILNGECEVIVDSSVLAVRTVGECVGEIALLENTPRTATLRSKSDCVFLTMVRSQFDDFIQLVPEKRQELKELVEERKKEASAKSDTDV